MKLTLFGVKLSTLFGVKFFLSVHFLYICFCLTFSLIFHSDANAPGGTPIMQQPIQVWFAKMTIIISMVKYSSVTILLICIIFGTLGIELVT